MCIRDSHQVAPRRAAQDGADRRRRRRRRRGGGARDLGGGAVSYTHLRAHETVLDIVCRLLLEKKTKTGYHRIVLIEITTHTAIDETAANHKDHYHENT